MAGDTRAIEAEIDRIRSLGLEELRREWRRLHHSEPPRIRRDLLIRGIGYRLQEVEYGGLGKSTRRKLQTMAKALRTTGRVGPMPTLSLKPGTRCESASNLDPTPVEHQVIEVEVELLISGVFDRRPTGTPLFS